jgi:hypothetical protein
MLVGLSVGFDVALGLEMTSMDSDAMLDPRTNEFVKGMLGLRRGCQFADKPARSFDGFPCHWQSSWVMTVEVDGLDARCVIPLGEKNRGCNMLYPMVCAFIDPFKPLPRGYFASLEYIRTSPYPVTDPAEVEVPCPQMIYETKYRWSIPRDVILSDPHEEACILHNQTTQRDPIGFRNFILKVDDDVEKSPY